VSVLILGEGNVYVYESGYDTHPVHRILGGFEVKQNCTYPDITVCMFGLRTLIHKCMIVDVPRCSAAVKQMRAGAGRSVGPTKPRSSLAHQLFPEVSRSSGVLQELRPPERKCEQGQRRGHGAHGSLLHLQSHEVSGRVSAKWLAGEALISGRLHFVCPVSFSLCPFPCGSSLSLLSVAELQVIGTALQPTAIDVGALPLSRPTILVLGNEGHGIRTNILRRCDKLVRIKPFGPAGEGEDQEPAGEVDSLNVSVTGGILLHHIMSSATSRT